VHQNERCTPGVCPPLYLASQANDWMHGNSVSRTPDGNLLLSIRNQDWVVLIDYQDGKGSGQVMGLRRQVAPARSSSLSFPPTSPTYSKSPPSSGATWRSK